MNTKSRTRNSFRNMAITACCQFTLLIFSFVTRTVFIDSLGTDYLGINGLYSNILSVLSMADLGIGSAIAYALYKPIARGDEREISTLMNYYKKIYRYIALGVAAVGLCIVPFLNVLVKTEQQIDRFHLITYYLLFLANSVTSYLLAYKSTMLLADQNSHIVRISHTFFSIAANIGELLILKYTGSYIAYLLIQLSCTLLNNLIIAFIVDKKYSFIKKYHDKLSKEKRTNIFTNVKCMFFYKIGGVIVNNTDNILISAIISTTIAGIYSNYTLILNPVIQIVEYLLNTKTRSIGNLNASGDKKNSEKIFNSLTVFNFWLFGFCSAMLFALIDDFIRLWLHKESFILGTAMLIATVGNIFFTGIMRSMAAFRETTGIFRQTRYIFAFTSVLNIILSIIMGKTLGLSGIIFATIISKALTCFWYEPYMLYKHFFGTSCLKYFVRQFLFIFIEAAVCAAIYFIKPLLPSLGYTTFILEAVIAAAIFNAVFLVVFGPTKEFRFLLGKLKFLPFKKK